MLELLDGFFRTLSLVIGMAVNTGAGSNFRMKEYLFALCRKEVPRNVFQADIALLVATDALQ